MRIGELSARTGTSERMLRYYQEQGLLHPTRTGSGYRIFTEDDVGRVARIRCMLSAALPTDVIRRTLDFLLDGRTVIPDLPDERARLVDTLQAELDALTERIAALRESHDLLSVLVADVQGAVVGPGRPGDTAAGHAYTAVHKTGPAVGRAARPRA